ncbi:MAG: serine/threonine-protein phosphatase [Bryobacteraceae bacterium]|nr:serine/threonine-protein phosphatase [Bryobacteraceae bacterium]
MIDSYGFTDRGCHRTDNQDRYLIDHDLGFYVVADGMGGHRHGEVAAELAIATMRYYVESSHDRADVSWPFGYDFELSVDSNRLTTAIQLANRQVWKRAEEKPEYAGMGTTIAAVLVDGAQAAVANVGDSRVYLFRGGELEQVTTDDTWLNAILQRGTSESQLRNHPMRNVLTQAAGSQNDVSVHNVSLGLQPSDIFLLSSDGLHGSVPEEEIRDILGTGGPLEGTGAALLEAAKKQGAPDNVSCILLRF